VADLAGQREPLVGRGAVLAVVVAPVPVGVRADGASGDRVEREALGVEPPGGRDGHDPVDVVRVALRPLQDVHPPDAAADDGAQSPHAEVIEQAPLGARPVFDLHWREGGPPSVVVGLLGELQVVGALARRAGRAVTGVGDGRADDEVLRRIDRLPRADDVVPPRAGLPGLPGVPVRRRRARDVLAPRERVADQHDVVAVELAVRLVGDLEVRDRLAALEGELAERGDALVGRRAAHSPAPPAARSPAASPRSRSSITSSGSSIPTESRSMSGDTPASRC